MIQSMSLMMNSAWLNLKSRLTKEDGAVDLVAIVIIIAIVVILAVVFREFIFDFIGSMFKAANDQKDDLAGGAHYDPNTGKIKY